MEVKLSGMLRHRFHGTYGADIVLVVDAKLANAVCGRLGNGWTVGVTGNAIVWRGGVDDLDALKERLQDKITITPCGLTHCKHQCAHVDIDSTAHSIDFGPRFTLTLEVDDPRQEAMF